MSDENWVEFRDLDAEVDDLPVKFADTVYVVSSMQLNVEEELDLRLAVALARDTAREKNIFDEKNSYWGRREEAYSKLLKRLNDELIPF